MAATAVACLYGGPAALTRALEAPILAAAAHAGVANDVHDSSVTHRYASIPSVNRFLTEWDAGSYAATKLANVLFAYECHRRWGAAGVRSAAVGTATLTNFASNYLVALYLPTMIASYGQAGTYYVFSVMGVIALASIYLTVPETKGKSLEEIEAAMTR